MFPYTDLMLWYRDHSRSLPWRENPDPYWVLLSEILCQQTRVETALPYFERFVARWPTLEDLALDSEDAVLEMWAGLGYYSRARNLHRCARAAVESGGIPDTADGLKALPGIGPYTAGAIASIAFGRRSAAVDGNIMRVLARWHAVAEALGSSRANRAFWAAAEKLHADCPPDVHPGDLNQALMELGARVCAPRRPACETCPVRAGCSALSEGRVTELPVPKVRKPPKPMSGVAAVWRERDAVFMARRAGKGLLGGLWGPPFCLDEPDPNTLVDVMAQMGLRVVLRREIGTVVHVFSHRKLTMRVFEVDGQGDPHPSAEWTEVGWRRGVEGVSGLAAKLLALEPVAQLPLLAAEPE